LDSVIAHSFLAGLALADVRTYECMPEAASRVDHALGQISEIVREVHDAALQLQSADARIRTVGPADLGGGGTT